MFECIVHDDWSHCHNALAGQRMFALRTRGVKRYDRLRFQAGDTCSGPNGASCSINLANAVAIVIYEGWRQLDFALPK